MSQATVYKTLALLKEMGQVLEINLRDDSHYDGNRPQPHPHLICIRCNKIVDGEFALDQVSLHQVEQRFRLHCPEITDYFLRSLPGLQKEGKRKVSFE